MWYFLESKFFSKRYPELIKQMFLSKPLNMELFFNNYTVNSKQSFIPENITQEELYRLCEDYIESNEANLNYLQLISQGIQNIKGLSIDAKLKLKTKRKIELLEKEYFKNKSGRVSSGFSQKIAVYTEKEGYFNANKDELKSLIDVDYIKNQSSSESLLEYLMYLDYFFTGNWILNLCSFPNLESSTLMRTLSGVKTKRNYETSFYFSNKNNLLLLSFKVLQDKLNEELDLRIEDLITYFFDIYCQKNYGIRWLSIIFANRLEKINIQTKNLFILEEQLRKQWKLFVEEKEIDKELFELESTPKIGQLKSLVNKKYIYLNEKNEFMKTIMHLLFSDQSHLTYINEELHEDSFVQLLFAHKIKHSFFNEYQQQNINYLIENNIISKDTDDIIYANKKQIIRISILSSLFKYDVINYYKWAEKVSRVDVIKNQQSEIDQMIEEGFLVYENTLFSKPEIDYLNYILNDSEFDNSLGIRNKYLHGSIIEDNYQDMLYALIILVTYVIKINEELTLNEESQNY